MSAPVWPAQPMPGHPVEVPLQAPPTLMRALDYLGDSQYVALYQDRSLCMIDDGVTTDDADPHGWHLFRNHTLVRRLLNGYHLGSEHEPAQHRLVVDRLTGRLTIALPEDAEQLLASQPRTRDALTGDMSPGDAARYLDAAAEVAQARVDAALDTWLEYARDLRMAQRSMVGDLDVDFGGRLAAQIRGLAATIRDATKQPKPPGPSLESRWTDLNQNPRQTGPAGPDQADPPGPEPDLS
ncbi:hypothetical protein AB0H83_29795 [Dactylosporangium sp. NPDC050688]|uniref:hypothetical protein n=1 Tax=Dactylosporangium sp. NPDC050688 TaxID=3157217 RepID=UPI0033C5B070